MNKKEKDLNCSKVVKIHKDLFQVQLTNPSQPDGDPKTFTFDAVFDDDSTQAGVYQETAYSLVTNVLDGYNGTIFAYGQTGCGKTFTMEGVRGGPPELRGIIPGTFEQIFRAISINEDPNKQFLVRAAYLEIYNEEVRDLLGSSPKTPLDLKEDREVGVYVKGLSQNVVKDCEQVMDLMAAGNKNRSVGFTLMNAGSSRSHSIFMLKVETSVPDTNGKPGDLKIKAGKLNLVDLAGSERQGKTGAEGQRLKEATKINLSLSALGNVISALVAGKGKHIPYRDSKLTRLLQDSLGGNTKTIMIAALSPADYNYEETLSTLRYANRAKNIRNKPKINEDPKDAMLREYADEINRLKAILQREGLTDFLKDGPSVPASDTNAAQNEKTPVKKVKKKVKKTKKATAGTAEEEETEEESEEDLEEGALAEMTEAERTEYEEKQKVLQQQMEEELARHKAEMEEHLKLLAAEKAQHEQQAKELAKKMEAEKAERERLAKEKADLEARGGTLDENEAQTQMHEKLQNEFQKQLEKHQLLAEELQDRMYDESQKHDELQQSLLEAKRKMKEEKKTLKEKLRDLQQKLLQGGQKATDLAVKNEEAVRRQQAELEEEKRRQAILKQQAEQLEEANLVVEEKYSSLKDELVGKTNKLRKLKKRVREIQEELIDLQHEYEGEKEDYVDNIRDAYRELRLHKRIAEMFLLKADIDQIVKLSFFSDELGKWNLPRIELPVSLPSLGNSNSGASASRGSKGGGKWQERAGNLGAAKKAADAGWKTSVRAGVMLYGEEDSRRNVGSRTSNRSMSPAPARLEKMDGMLQGPAIRNGDGSAAAIIQAGSDRDNPFPDSLQNVRVRPAFDAKQGDLKSSGDSGAPIDFHGLPQGRPNFSVSKAPTKSSDEEDVLDKIESVPRRKNFDAPGKGCVLCCFSFVVYSGDAVFKSRAVLSNILSERTLFHSIIYY